MRGSQKSLIILIVVLATAFSHEIKHECIHHKLKHKNVYAESTLKQDFGIGREEGKQRRNLQTSRNMVVTYDTDWNSQFASLTSDQQAFITSAMKIALKFINKSIFIVPEQGDVIKYSCEAPGTQCQQCENGFDIPDNNVARTEGKKGSDLHLFVRIKADATDAETFIAYAGHCLQSKANNRPIFGYVTINKKLIPSNLSSTRLLSGYVDTIIHEITHVLGMSSALYTQFWDKENKKAQAEADILTSSTFAGKTTQFIITPKVKAVAQEYFNCPTLIGAALETEGSQGSSGSHWDRALLMDEIMTATNVVGQASYSQFTLAILEDSNWYHSIDYNMAGYLRWGKGAGCEFAKDSCQSTTQTFPEFCATKAENGLDFYNQGVGQCNSDEFSDGCMYFTVASNYNCLDETLVPQDETLTQEQFGEKSRSFQSNVIFSTDQIPVGDQQYRCYEAECEGTSQVKVILGSNTIVCDVDGQTLIDPGTGLKGKLFCPSSISKFCQKPRICPDYCSKNGYCTNGVCECIQGYFGPSCKCTKFVLSGNCVDACPLGTTADQLTKNCIKSNKCKKGEFQAADTTCKACKSPCGDCIQTQSKCLQCVSTSYQYVSSTFSCQMASCPAGTYMKDGACANCYSACKTCEGTAEKCTSCATGLTLNAGKCEGSCPTSSQYKDTASNTCQDCDISCATCSGSAVNCLSCISKDHILQNGKCSQTCLDSTYKSGNKCVTSCPNGTFANDSNKQCSPCFQGCTVCSKEATNCSQCVEGYTLSSSQCVSSCDPGQFYDSVQQACDTCNSSTSSCQTCITTASQCLSCIDQFYLKENICQQTCGISYFTHTTTGQCVRCESMDCDQCSTAVNVCETCQTGTYLYQDSCVTSCPAGSQVSGNTCAAVSPSTVKSSLINQGISLLALLLIFMVFY